MPAILVLIILVFAVVIFVVLRQKRNSTALFSERCLDILSDERSSAEISPIVVRLVELVDGRHQRHQRHQSNQAIDELKSIYSEAQKVRCYVTLKDEIDELFQLCSELVKPESIV